MTENNVASKHETSINRIKWIAIIFFIITIGVYFIRFWGWPPSPQTDVWGQFGDFVGGLLNPIFSFFVIWILVEDLTSSRKEAEQTKRESEKIKLAQAKSAEALIAQVQIMQPKPNIIFYPVFSSKRYYLHVENIGKATAFEVSIGISPSFSIDYPFIMPGQVLRIFIKNVDPQIWSKGLVSFYTANNEFGDLKGFEKEIKLRYLDFDPDKRDQVLENDYHTPKFNIGWQMLSTTPFEN